MNRASLLQHTMAQRRKRNLAFSSSTAQMFFVDATVHVPTRSLDDSNETKRFDYCCMGQL